MTEPVAMQSKGGLFDAPRYCYDRVASTNDVALGLAEDGAVIVADAQDHGRGRHGHRWESAPGDGLYVSVCLAGTPFGTTWAAALAIRDTLQTYLHPDQVHVRWPNDVVASERKIAGILAEGRSDWTALGIGINVRHTPGDFDESLRDTATSLAIEGAAGIEPNAVADRLLPHLETRLARIRNGHVDAIRDEWIAACNILGQHVNRGTVSGIVATIDTDGALLVRNADGLHRVTDAREWRRPRPLATEAQPCSS